MSDEHPTTSKEKPASGPKRATTRKRRLNERKAYTRNSLYTLAAEYKKRHPQATAQEVWRHFVGLVGVSSVLLAYDSTGDMLTYAPDPDRYGSREIKRRSFEQGYYKLG